MSCANQRLIFYRNKASGDLYQVLALGTDHTNVRDGTDVVVYHPVGLPEVVCVRECVEFSEKFEAQPNAVPCPDAATMGEHACHNAGQCWDPCGELGHSEAHVRVVPE